MDRAVIYARVSSDEQAEGHSLNAQVEQCTLYCEKNGYAVTKVYREDFTGTTANRPGMNELLASHELFDVMVVYQVDRLSRSRTAMIVIEMELERLNKRTEFVIGNFDSSPEGNLFKNLMVDFAQFDRENLLRRTASGKLGRIRSGQIMVSHPLFGYDYISGERTGSYAINEIEAGWVKKIFSWYANDGDSVLGIAKRLTAARVPTKADKLGTRASQKYGMWYEIGVSRVLNNPAYYGEWQWGRGGKMVQKIAIPPIVSKELFDAAQAKKSQNKLLARRNTKEFYLLRGRLRCENCWQAYIASNTRRANGVVDRYYRCKGAMSSAKHNWKRVCEGQLRAEDIDAAVWEHVKAHILRPELALEGLRAKNELIKNSTAQFRATAELLETQIAKLEEKRTRLLELYSDAKIPKEDLEKVMADNIRESGEARERLVQLRSVLGEEVTDPEQVRSFLDELAPAVGEATPGEMLGVIGDLAVTAVVSRDRKTILVESPYVRGFVAIA